jgi:hypothetical protein
VDVKRAIDRKLGNQYLIMNFPLKTLPIICYYIYTQPTMIHQDEMAVM